MKLINITFENGKQAIFKTSNVGISKYTTSMLNPAILKNKNDINSNALLYFGVKNFTETSLDGRTKFAKNLPYFSFKYCFENLKNK